MKKKIFAGLLSLCLLATMMPSMAYGATKWDTVKSQKLSTAITAATKNNTKLQTNKNAFSKFENLVNKNTASTAGISQAEINSLLSESQGKDKLTYAEAVSDVELYFKALKYGYGAYEYFGGDTKFNKAKQQILNKLSGKSTVSFGTFREYLKDAMSFVADTNFSIDGESGTRKYTKDYQYYYNASQKFSKDSKGYYKTLNGKKWYYKSCSTKNVTMQKSLTTTGDIVYSPVLFCAKANAVKKSTITLVNGKSKKKETVKWTTSKAFGANELSQDPNFEYLEKNNIAYISVRNFYSGFGYDDELSQFVESGTSAQNAEMIIFDIRSCSGGGNSYVSEWIKNFTGDNYVLNEAFSRIYTALTGETYGKEVYDININTGYMIKNNIPIIVLVDDQCANMGEYMLLGLRSLENVIVIGSNSAGDWLASNQGDYTLPNSGLQISFGSSLQFDYQIKNVDGKGYTPDIWCDPSKAIKSVANMLKKQKYITSETASYLTSNHSDSYSQVCIEFVGSSVTPGDGFGRVTEENLNVTYGGEIITDYTVKSSDPSKLLAEKLSNGKLYLKAIEGKVAEDESIPITITYKGKEYQYRACC